MIHNVIVLIIHLYTFQQSASLVLEVTNIENDKGFVLVAISNVNEELIKTRKLPIKDGKANLEIKNMKYGKYAIKLFHDKNDNGELDRNLVGYPKEGFGFSNNAQPKMGPPDFEDQLFFIQGKTTHQIKMIYL